MEGDDVVFYFPNVSVILRPLWTLLCVCMCREIGDESRVYRYGYEGPFSYILYRNLFDLPVFLFYMSMIVNFTVLFSNDGLMGFLFGQIWFLTSLSVYTSFGFVCLSFLQSSLSLLFLTFFYIFLSFLPSFFDIIEMSLIFWRKIFCSFPDNFFFHLVSSPFSKSLVLF